jgi:hypothetical protein
VNKEEIVKTLEESQKDPDLFYGPKGAEALTLAIDTLKRIEVEGIRNILIYEHSPRLPLQPQVFNDLSQAIVTYLTEGK